MCKVCRFCLTAVYSIPSNLQIYALQISLTGKVGQVLNEIVFYDITNRKARG